MAQTDTQTDGRTWRLYDQLGPVGPSWWKLYWQRYLFALNDIVSVLWQDEGYTIKYSRSPRAQAIFHFIYQLESQYRHSQLQLHHCPSWRSTWEEFILRIALTAGVYGKILRSRLSNTGELNFNIIMFINWECPVLARLQSWPCTACPQGDTRSWWGITEISWRNMESLRFQASSLGRGKGGTLKMLQRGWVWGGRWHIVLPFWLIKQSILKKKKLSFYLVFCPHPNLVCSL